MSKQDFHPVEGIPEDDLFISDRWRTEVENRLTEMGQNQSSLGRHIGASRSGISQVLSRSINQERSIYVAKISAAVGVRLPLKAELEAILAEAERRGEWAEDALRNFLRGARGLFKTQTGRSTKP